MDSVESRLYASQATIKLHFLLNIEMIRNLVRIKTGKIL